MTDRADLSRQMDSQPLGLSLLGEISSEEEEEALHLCIEGLPGEGILDGGDEMRELIFHRLCRDTTGRGLEIEVRSTSGAMGG